MNDNGWTIETLKAHYDELRKADRELMEERDRRYAEVNEEKSKALLIEESARKMALVLASSELKTAIDELKSQLKPVLEYMISQQGKSIGLSAWFGYIIAAVSTGVMIYGFIKN